MDIENLTDDELDDLASKLAPRLPTGSYGDKVVLPRRKLLAAVGGGGVGLGLLAKLGIDPATAQSAAGQVGTSSSPEDVNAYNLDVQAGAEFNGTDLSGVGSLSTAKVAAVATATSSNQTIPSGTPTTIDIDTSVIDEFGGWDFTNNEYVVQNDGLYRATGHIEWASDSGWSTGDRAAARANLNGSFGSTVYELKIGTRSEEAIIYSTTQRLTSGDPISFEAFQDSGAGKDVDNVSSDANRFEIVKLG